MCTRLESTFKYKYRSEDYLLGMMDQYFDKTLKEILMDNSYDDENNDCYRLLEEDKQNTELNRVYQIERNLLHMLRIFNNSFVRSTQQKLILPLMN